ncbi:MAG: hypothetical protein ABIG39_03425 [Candidatus Micrarchaeota archaeon]
MANGNVIFHRSFREEKGLAMKEAINGRVIPLSHSAFERLLLDLGNEKQEYFPSIRNPFVAHGKPNTKLDTTIECKEGNVTYVFEVPDEARGQKNILLAASQELIGSIPLITLREDGMDRFVVQFADASKIKIVENYPTKSGTARYMTDKDGFGIPVGEPVDSSTEGARQLYRIDQPHVGFVVQTNLTAVNIYFKPSAKLGVVAQQVESG